MRTHNNEVYTQNPGHYKVENNHQPHIIREHTEHPVSKNEKIPGGKVVYDSKIHSKPLEPHYIVTDEVPEYERNHNINNRDAIQSNFTYGKEPVYSNYEPPANKL